MHYLQRCCISLLLKRGDLMFYNLKIRSRSLILVSPYNYGHILDSWGCGNKRWVSLPYVIHLDFPAASPARNHGQTKPCQLLVGPWTFLEPRNYSTSSPAPAPYKQQTAINKHTKEHFHTDSICNLRFLDNLKEFSVLSLIPTMPREFDNILNFRDVGKTVNEFLGKR